MLEFVLLNLLNNYLLYYSNFFKLWKLYRVSAEKTHLTFIVCGWRG